MSRTVLVLVASGRFGRHASTQFAGAGWAVRGFDRRRDDLQKAAQGADLIVNAWNPPYPQWASQVPGLHARVIAAARQSGSTVLVPGNVYVFGSDTPGPWSETTPHRAQNPLGRIRVAMEDAYRRSGVPTILLRAGDFLDTEASGNWFDAVMTRKLSKGVLTYPGDPEADHAWAFLPDLARAAVDLAERRRDLPRFCDVPFPGYTLTGQDMQRLLDPLVPGGCRLKRLNWLPMHLARPFWPMARCLVEMGYLWDMPHSLDVERFRQLLPDFLETPVQQALRAAIAPVIPGAGRSRQGDGDSHPNRVGPAPASIHPSP